MSITTSEDLVHISGNTKTKSLNQSEIEPICPNQYAEFISQKMMERKDHWEFPRLEAKKAVLRAEDMEKGIYITAASLPRQEPQRGTPPDRAVAT